MRAEAVVVITGASSGIGEATAHAFARRGCRLVLGARREVELRRVQAAIAGYGVTCLVHVCDVRREAEVRNLVGLAVEHFGRLDVLVNNAGAGYYGRVEDTSDEDFRNIFETNLFGVQYGIRAAVPIMRRQHSGHIVNVGSVVGKQSWPWHGAYAATKFALTGLTHALAAELAGSGVSASLVLPGSTRTNFFRRARIGTRGYRAQPIGFVQSPAAVARRIVSSVDHPSIEIDTLRVMRIAFVLAEAFPSLAGFVAGRAYLWSARRLESGSISTSRSEAAASRTEGSV